MHLMYYADASGKRTYTLKVRCTLLPELYARILTPLCPVCLPEDHPRGGANLLCTPRYEQALRSPAPGSGALRLSVLLAARFSPDDKFSRHRVACKKRHGLLPTQKPAPTL
jgi:rRNA maturation protein Nop10